MVQEHAAGLVGGQREPGPVSRFVCRLGLVLVAGDRGAIELEAERRQAEVVGRGDGERDRGDRRDVAADPDGPQRDPRLAVPQQADRQERGRESSPVLRRASARSPASWPRGGSTGAANAAVVDSARAPACCRTGSSRCVSPVGSVPTRVSSTSVSGRKTQVLARVVDVAEPAVGGPGLLDAQLGLGQRRPVDPLDRERIRASRRRRSARRSTSPTPAETRSGTCAGPGLDHRPSRTLPSAVRSRIEHRPREFAVERACDQSTAARPGR